MRDYSHTDHKNSWSDTDVEQHWDSVADIYIKENERVIKAHNQRFTESIRHLNLVDNIKILNVSSRDCQANDYIIKENSTVSVVNAEISQGLVNVAKKVRPNAEQVKITSYSELPFEDKTFSRIISLETLEHVANPIQFLKELHRISDDNTRMVLSCPPLTSEIPYSIFTKLFGGHGEGPHRFLRSSEVKAMLKKTGWKLSIHKGTVLIPVGPEFIQNFGEWFINVFQKTSVSELGIRQFFVCDKY